MQNKNSIQLILLDIDGVVYDFVNYILPLFDSSKTDKDILTYKMSDSIGCSSAEFWQKIDAIDGAFSNGSIYEWSRDLIELCKKFCPNIMFCSDPGNNPKHWAEKAKFTKQYFPDLALTLTQNKYLYSLPGVVLIDDFEKNCDAFDSHGQGKAILFPQYWNRNQEFRKDNKQLEYVECLLEDISINGTKIFKKDETHK